MAYKKNYKKRSNYKPRKKSAAKKSYTPSQKKSWLAGFMAGLKKKKKSASSVSRKLRTNRRKPAHEFSDDRFLNLCRRAVLDREMRSGIRESDFTGAVHDLYREAQGNRDLKFSIMANFDK